MNHLELAEINY